MRPLVGICLILDKDRVGGHVDETWFATCDVHDWMNLRIFRWFIILYLLYLLKKTARHLIDEEFSRIIASPKGEAISEYAQGWMPNF